VIALLSRHIRFFAVNVIIIIGPGNGSPTAKTNVVLVLVVIRFLTH